MKRIICWLTVLCIGMSLGLFREPARAEVYEEGYWDELYDLEDDDEEEMTSGVQQAPAGPEETEEAADAEEAEETADGEPEEEAGDPEEAEEIPETEAEEETPDGDGLPDAEEEAAASGDAHAEDRAGDGSGIFTFSLIGDCAIGDEWEHFGRKTYGTKSGIVYRIKQEGMAWPFAQAADLFAQDDLTIANCECTLSTTRKAKKQAMALIAPPEYAEAFRLGNIDICNLANNHSQDFFKTGRVDTAKALREQGIGVFYDDTPYSVTVKGVKIGIVGYCYPMDNAKLKKYVKYMNQLREEGCTFVIASAHWGREEKYALDGNQKFAVKMIDAGFDMVYGHGSHTCQMIRWYKGKVIFYGLSNFAFGANAAPKDDDTLVAQIRYDIHEDGTMTARDLTCIPFRMHKGKNYQPYPIPDSDTEGRMRVWEKLYYNNNETDYRKHKSSPAPSLPESFLTTGYVDFTTLPVTEE